MKEELFNEMIEEKLLKVIKMIELRENEFTFTMNTIDIINKRINIFRYGNAVGSLSIEEAFTYLNDEIEIIEKTINKTDCIVISKDYINSLIIKNLKDDYIKLGYEVTSTSINYNTIETVEDSYFNDVYVLLSIKKIETN